VVCAKPAIAQFDVDPTIEDVHQLKGYYCDVHYNDKLDEYKMVTKRGSSAEPVATESKKKRIDLDNNKDITRIEVYRKGLLIAALELPKTN
jgi:hypothetical protein